MSRCVGVAFPCPRFRFLRLCHELAFPRWVAIECGIGMILIHFQSHVNPDSVTRGHRAQTLRARSRPRRDRSYRRPAARTDSRWARSLLPARRYGWPRSRREQMSTWCREAAGHRPSLPPAGRAGRFPITGRGRTRSRTHVADPGASTDATARSIQSDVGAGLLAESDQAPPRATSPPAREAPKSRDRHHRLRHETTQRPERERREIQRMLGGPSTITS